jgi:hypothetical protein
MRAQYTVSHARFGKIVAGVQFSYPEKSALFQPKADGSVSEQFKLPGSPGF